MRHKLFVLLMTVAASAFSALPAMAATPDTLMKIACPANAGAEHYCRAVYYYGSDGKRHAFPNSGVYASWYPDFSTIEFVSATTLASIPLGANVTYRPGTTMVKFITLNTTYAVTTGGVLRWVKDENVARALYGESWNQRITDVSDVFFNDYRFGPDIVSAAEYNLPAEFVFAKSIDDTLDSTWRSIRVETERGQFEIELVTLNKAFYSMITDTAEKTACSNNCAAKSLADYAAANGATIGIHGSYFCPPDYADCATKINTFFSPVFNSGARVMMNAADLALSTSPMVAYTRDGRYFFFHRTSDFGNSVAQFEQRNSATLDAAISNYPSLVENGTVLVLSEPRLDEGQKTVKATRGAIGFNDRFVHLVIAKHATVVDLASIMLAIGSDDAMNLDGGGSAALLYNGNYVIGPGRLLPNAILFKRK